MGRVNTTVAWSIGAVAFLVLAIGYFSLKDGGNQTSEHTRQGDENQIENPASSDDESRPESADNKSGAGEIKVLAPKSGHRVLGTQVDVKGTAANMDSLSIDNQNIKIDDNGHWESSFIRSPGLQIIRIQGVSTNGPKLKEEVLTLIGDGLELDQPIDEGLVFFLSKQALKQLAQALSTQIQPDEVESAVVSTGPLYRDRWNLPFGAGSVHLQVSLTELHFDEVVSQITPQDGHVNIDIQIHNLRADTITSASGISYIESTISAGRIDLNCTLTPSLETGSIRVSIPKVEVNIVDFQSPLTVPDIVSNWVSSDFVNHRIQATIETTLRNEIKRQLPQQLNAYLKTLDQPLEVPMGEQSLSLTVQPSRLDIDKSGLTIAFSQSMPIPTAKPNIPALLLGAKPPEPIPGHSATLSIGDDLANRLLHQLWANGHLDFDLRTEDATLATSVAKSLGTKHARLRVSSGLPPVLIDTPNGVQLQVGPVEVILDSPNGTYGNRMELELVLWVELEFVLDGRSIRIRQTDVQFDQTIVDHDWRVAKPIISTTLNLIIDLEKEIDRALEQVSIPIPEIPGIQLTGKAIMRAKQAQYMQGAIEIR